MPPHLPSSFASAAAGQNSNRDGRGNTSGEWSRTGRANGTLTFRRPSTTPSNQSLNQNLSTEPAPQPATMVAAAAVPPSSGPQRYTRDQLLAIFDSVPETEVSTLFAPGWNPGQVNGGGPTPRGWGKSSESQVQPQEPELCWDTAATSRANNLKEMTDEEKDLFSTDVNSPVKLPPINTQNTILNGRKTSVSHGASNNNFSLASPSSASRPGTRRRETTDTNPYSGSAAGGLASPTAARPPRDEASFWPRKNAEVKDSMYEEAEEDLNLRDAAPGQNPSLPFGGLMRNNTASSATGLAAASALWGQPVTSPSVGSFGNFALPGSSAIGDKRPPANTQSRLARLLPKDSNDSIASRVNEPASATDTGRPWRPRQRTDTDPFGGDDSLSGSAILGGSQDTSPPAPTARNPVLDTPVKGSAGDLGMAGLNLGSQDPDAPASPSETNPYRSPPGEAEEGSHGHVLGLGGPDHGAGFPGGVPRAFGQPAFDGSDRSQTSSVGAKAYPPLSNLTGWPSSGTPDRERNPFGNAFGNSLFGGMGDLHSPSLGNLGGVFGPASAAGLVGSGSAGRGSKLGSLFPAAMQSQMHGQDTESLADSVPDLRHGNPLGAIGRNAFGEHSRDSESPMRGGRGVFGDMFPSDPARAPGSTEGLPGTIGAVSQPPNFPQSTGSPFNASQTSEPPAAQPRSMVMPDRMRWVYLDPQGQQQGPFTGLEMNDWYKAQFFTADLRVKRVEDPEFEPLGQLIRRIGNSREPFLVPMMGIPHGPPSASGPFSANASGVIQPPLVGAFPSFGRTLTAQEQNDLERRKQEEQYLMAQQRDFLSNQHRIARVQMQGHPGLHHHSSAHSLQSQPSFGSMTSPIAMPPHAPIGSIGGAAGSFLAGPPQQPPIGPGSNGPSLSDMFREEELARLSAEERQAIGAMHGPGPIGSSQPIHPVAGSSMESFRNRLPGTQELVEDEEGFRGRLEEFEQLRAQHEAQAEHSVSDEQSPPTSTLAPHIIDTQGAAKEKQVKQQKESAHVAQEGDSVSLAKQVEQAQTAAAAAKNGLPMPFPPPQSSTPLPAPAPQRIKSNLPEQYATGSRSATPDVMSSPAASQPPPLAPWAKDNATESHRGPSLKEIQEAEAKKAAKAEEAAAAMRRAAAEQEAVREREKVATSIASGLPTTSTWGTTASPGANNGSPWSMPAVTKNPTPGLGTPIPSNDKKKTLADIQREEEARKVKTMQSQQTVGAAPSGGKRYADLASKPNAVPGATAPSPTPAAGWSTVGAGGKVKIPTGPAAQSRSASSSNVKPAGATPSPVAARPVVAKVGSANNTRSEAMDEFNKWIHSQLSRGISGVTDIESFARSLLEFPPEASIIAEAIYGHSKTMNGQHFAAEFLRRKKLAEKGVVEKQGAADVAAQAGNTGGWNEVAKKNPHKETSGESGAIPAGFKSVVSSGQPKSTQALEINEEAIGLGSAAFNAFLQANVTGPSNKLFSTLFEKIPEDKRPSARSGESSIELLRRTCLRTLDVDGVSLFCFARWSRDILELSRDLAWIRFRIHLWHYKLLSQPSLGPDVATLQELIEKSLSEAESGLFQNTSQESSVGKVQFLLEKANAHIMLGSDAQAKDAPSALPLNDDTLLEKISFTVEGEEKDAASQSTLPVALQELTPENQPRLNPEDQIILLTEATIKDTFSPADTLTSEEILPFAVRVIDDSSTNWQIYTQALLVRSRIELNRSRTVERGVLQMQAVVDQVVVDTDSSSSSLDQQDDSSNDPSIPTIEVSGVDGPDTKKPTTFLPAPQPSESASPQLRLRYVHALSSPPRWHLESELAFGWASVGSMVSALEIFKRLRLWPEVALCLATTAAADDEDGRGSGGEEKGRAIVRWRLYHRTGESADASNDEDYDKAIDTDTLNAKDFYGPERNPPPPNAPRLLCILGDMENEPKHYERAWEISNRRFGRAQRSLGEHYLRDKNWEKACEAYRLAVSVNRLSPDLWSRLGDIELRLGRFPDATEAFQRAIGVSNSEEGGEGARTWSNLGTALLSWYRQVVKENKGQQAKKPVDSDDEEEAVAPITDDQDLAATKPATARAMALGKPAHKLLQDALVAFKRGATIAQTNWRIWDNVVTLAASITPEPAIDDVIIGYRNVLRIRNVEDALDPQVLNLLLRELGKETPIARDAAAAASDAAVFDPARGSTAAKIVAIFEEAVVPLITARSDIWSLVSRERAWRRDWAGSLEAAEKGWRAASAMGSSSSSSGSSLQVASPSAGGASSGGDWQSGQSKEAWEAVVERTSELVAAYENWGPRIESIGEQRWKGKARSAVRSIMGKGKESWEGSEGWRTLEGIMEDLRA
ncbi:hypothetical protein BX600DRAFT_483581 [Xylariales sp. PMI_506]|nr:hypothetical protein BX600DRAFT_483581 [Xylariales sp. PMI_506]